MSDDAKDGPLPTIDAILGDPAASFWLKAALPSALSRDLVDAANDAAVLAQVLESGCRIFWKTLLTRPHPTEPSRDFSFGTWAPDPRVIAYPARSCSLHYNRGADTLTKWRTARWVRQPK